MSILYTARTGSGVVTVTEQNVTLDRPGGMTSESVNRASITSVQQKTTMMSLFGIGGAKQVTIRTQDGRALTLRVVKPRDAKQLLALLR